MSDDYLPKLNPDQIESVLEIYDRTDPKLQREIVAAFANKAYWLERLVRSCVRTSQRLDDTTHSTRDEPGVLCGPTWSKVSHLLGVGSTYAIRICRAFDVDPDFDCSTEEREE